MSSRLTLQYFYGNRRQYSPHLLEGVKFDEVQIFQIGTAATPDSLLPAGMGASTDHKTAARSYLLSYVLQLVYRHKGPAW